MNITKIIVYLLCQSLVTANLLHLNCCQHFFFTYLKLHVQSVHKDVRLCETTDWLVLADGGVGRLNTF